MTYRLAVRALCWTLVAAVGLATPTISAAQKVPAGFKAELLFQAPEVEHPSVVTCDDDGNLFVGEDPMDMRGPTTEEFDRVLFIKFDADGKPVRKTVFCDKLSAVFGLCWLDGALYVMHAPHYTRFRDTDGDGVADERTELADGFGPPAGVYGFNDHIVTGTRLGLDGYLYVSVGDKGIQKATGADGSAITLEGGGVVRMLPNGTRLEVVTSGTRNHLDVAMDSLDNIFTYDNTDDGLGWWTRFTHHIPTGYYGYPYDYHPHPDRHLPRISEHGGGSPVGAAAYREAAWPEEYRQNAFHCEWGKRKIQRFKLAKSGASFTAEMHDFMTPEEGSEFRPQDLCFSPDGKHMYVADWQYGGWTKPDVLGRLYRVTYVGDDVPAEPPRGKRADGLEQQLAALWHPAHAERVRAQDALVDLGQAAIAPLEKLLASDAPPAAKVHAIWALYHLSTNPQAEARLTAIESGLKDANADVRGQAARALGELLAIRSSTLNPPAADAARADLVKALLDKDPAVRLRAAIAVGQTHTDAPAELFKALAEDDLYVRFAVVQALRRIGDWKLAGEHLDATDEKIRSGLLLALTGQYTDGAVAALSAAAARASEPSVRATALPLLAEVHLQAEPYTTGWWGTQPARSQPARPQKNDWSGTSAVVAAVRQGLEQANPDVRAAAVRAVREIKDPASLAAVRELLKQSKDELVLREALDTLAALKDVAASAHCIEIAADVQRPDAIRAAAVTALGQIGGAEAVAPIAKLLGDPATPADVAASGLASLAELKGDAAIAAVAERIARGTPALRCQAIEIYANLAGTAGGSTLAGQLNDGERTVREASIRALGQIAHRDCIPQLLPLASDVELRFVAIQALAAMPDRRALGSYLDGAGDKSPDLRAACRQALAALRDEIGDDLIELDRRRELTAAARRELAAVFSAPDLIREWQIAGAWSKEHRPSFDPTIAPNLDHPVFAGDKSQPWKLIKLGPQADRMRLQDRVKPVDNAWCLGYAVLEADQAASSELLIGSDDQLTVWLNGQQVYDYGGARGWSADQGQASVKLQPGKNHLWALIGNDGAQWEFSVAVRRTDPKFAFLTANVPDQLSPEAYREFALGHAGNAERGKKLFEDRQGVGCIKCHAVGGQGATIGPDLLSVGAKYPREELVRSVLEPSNRILSGYQVTIVVTDDGRTFQGIIKRETPELIELVDAEGKTASFPLDSIEERETANVSMMPNGLKDGLTLEDFADVVSYLESLKTGLEGLKAEAAGGK